MFSLLMILFSIYFLFLNHPLSLGLIIILQTILISFTTGLMAYNYWFSYIIFLIMIGGMLILFIYMTSVASNEKFKLSYKLILLTSFFLLFLSILIFMDFFFFNLNFIDNLINQNSYFNFKLSLNKFINWPLNLNFYLMVIYLLITLIMIVKITNIKSGPLRQKM
uniref:NADH-ubiquinone oxidoreductase chain 6 n=1 Tax=Olenecamptus bilobus TaxID=1850319 RepID=A0A7G7WQA8_9CUCU|nr:NADH dehydrogenase subunit 6 [Olenecamptus bilobus]QNH68735.1 NADH dehydrogenase subunit 6 [Olenecamptus bilobus]